MSFFVFVEMYLKSVPFRGGAASALRRAVRANGAAAMSTSATTTMSPKSWNLKAVALQSVRRGRSSESVASENADQQALRAGSAIRRVLRKRAYGAFQAPPIAYDGPSRQLFVRGSGNDPQVAAQRIVERVIAKALSSWLN